MIASATGGGTQVNRSTFSLPLVSAAVALLAVTADAARLDMNDPRRALGREDDVRIDAQLSQDSVSPGSSVSVTYQVQNLSPSTVAIADKIADVSYDADTQTLTLSVGSEVPSNGTMPHLTVIGPGEKKTMTAGGVVRVNLPTVRSPFIAVPRFVQVKVNVLRDVTPFSKLIEEQKQAHNALAAIALPDDLFDKWIESNDAIFLNAIPVYWNPNKRSGTDASERRATSVSAPAPGLPGSF